MRKFIYKLLTKLDKLDAAQIHSLVHGLVEEIERYEGMLAASVDNIIISDLDFCVVGYNYRAEKYMNTDHLRSFYGRKVWTVIADRNIAAFVRKTLEAGEISINKEFPLESGGEKRIMNITVIPLSTQGKVHGYLYFMNDITLLKSTETRLRRAENLASLTNMTASVAHEIKNPLSAIGIYIQLIRKAVQGKSSVAPDLILKHLNVVSSEVERLNKIVVDFLYAVRPMNIKPERTDLARLMRDILDFVRGELAAAKIKIEEKFSRNLPKVFIDAKAMRQAVLNIIKNAIDAMPRGGTLTVSMTKREDYVRLVISDTGEGIPLENQDQIFEPYFTTRETGTGLGLTNVLKIIKEHGADISFDSEPGKGTAFIICFPIPEDETRLLEYTHGGEDAE